MIPFIPGNSGYIYGVRMTIRVIDDNKQLSYTQYSVDNQTVHLTFTIHQVLTGPAPPTQTVTVTHINRSTLPKAFTIQTGRLKVLHIVQRTYA